MLDVLRRTHLGCSHTRQAQRQRKGKKGPPRANSESRRTVSMIQRPCASRMPGPSSRVCARHRPSSGTQPAQHTSARAVSRLACSPGGLSSRHGHHCIETDRGEALVSCRRLLLQHSAVSTIQAPCQVPTPGGLAVSRQISWITDPLETLLGTCPIFHHRTGTRSGLSASSLRAIVGFEISDFLLWRCS